MIPRIQTPPPAELDAIHAATVRLLAQVGIAFPSHEAQELLAAAGASVDGNRASIPEAMVRRALDTVPHAFDLFDRSGRPAVRYGQGIVHFDPGS